MDLDVITIITYVCAALGVLLLLLCLILASYLIIILCKKHFGNQNRTYSIVPRTRDPVDIEQAVLSRYRINNEAAKGLSGLKLIDEVDDLQSKDGSKNYSAPIKRKLFWKKKKEKSSVGSDAPDDSRFTDDELNAGKPKHFFKKRRQVSFSNRKLSKSDWYIYSRSQVDDETIYEEDEEENESLLYPHQVISLIGSPVRSDEVKQSQYFDALETIKEEKEELEESDDNDWTDESSDDEEVLTKPKVKHKLRPNNHPLEVRRRIKALKRIQFESEKLEAKFYRELFYLEAEFSQKKREPLYEKRFQIVNLVDGLGGTGGVDQFWLQAMRNCPTLDEIIQIHDYPVLKLLKDIKIKTDLPQPSDTTYLDREHLDFVIEFYFQEDNPYFENKVLIKEYFLKCEPDPNLPFSFEGPEVVTCKGCKIHWKKGKNITLQPVKKVNKENGQLVTKFSKRNSFFNFFTPPKSVREWILDPKKSELMESHFEIGLFFKENFVPKAILYYANHSVRNLVDEAKDASTKLTSNKKVEGRKTKKNNPVTKINSNLQSSSEVSQLDSSGRISVMSKPEDLNSNTRDWYKLMTNVSPNSSLARNRISSVQIDDDQKPANNHENHHDNHHDNHHVNDLVNHQPPAAAKDPIVGRFRLTTSEGFDEFLKALGVGLVKRKLANSVTPTLVVEVDSDGLYIVRTETSVSTAELKFRLNEPFTETTMDGRTVTTTATRNGNVLTLEQKGDASKGEKDSTLVRDFQGDVMKMTMKIQNIVCNREYQRIQE